MHLPLPLIITLAASAFLAGCKEEAENHTVDYFTGAVHGFAPPYTERYDRAASEKHWERIHAMFRRKLSA